MTKDGQTNLFSALIGDEGSGNGIPGVSLASELKVTSAKRPPAKKKKPVKNTTADDGPTVWTVSSLTQLFRKTISDHDILGQSVVVRGELSNVNPSSRGHVYMNLKDEKASLRGVIWASKAARLPFDIDDGMEVFATGKLDIYAAGGSYSLVIDRLEPVGVGALQLAFEQLKAKLTEEGLFDADRKQPIPAFPKRIGIVTAKTGAVIHDMLRVIRRKNPQLDVLLAPVAVQGQGAAETIAKAITHLNQPEYNLDLLIVGRGGGSFDDLFCFSEEPVVRAIANSALPVVAGVGHEPDFSLTDAVADLSCSTPTAAAEAAVPDTIALQETLQAINGVLAQGLTHALTNAEQQLDGHSDRLIEGMEQHLDKYQQQLTSHRQQLAIHGRHFLNPYEHTLSQLATTLDNVSPLATLKRGYWAATDNNNAAITSIKQLSDGDAITLKGADGTAQATITQTRTD
jgi:exodeoxyribonuclease VII large subunit